MTNQTVPEPSKHWYYTLNPLMDCLPNVQEPSDLLDLLAFDPMAGIDVTNLSTMRRIALLTGEKTTFEPTVQSLRAATTWWGMHEMGLRVRNPRNPVIKRHVWSVVNASATGNVHTPLFPTRGISVNLCKGPTGTGKTVTAERFCEILPKVWHHGRNDEAGWMELKQLVCLNAMVPHDGTRGGFLESILQAVDKALGTTYRHDLPRRTKSVDRLAVATIAVLVAHYTGILFLDEAQLRNLQESAQASQLQGLILMIMNSGVPTVIVGNEMAFDWLESSQDNSRITVTPEEYFTPIGAIDRRNARSDWSPVASGIMKFYLLRSPVDDPERCADVLRRCGGGIPRSALTLWCNTQLTALERGYESIDYRAILETYNSRSFDRMRPVADGFRYRRPELLLPYNDIDAAFYARHWNKTLTTNIPPLPQASLPPVSTDDSSRQQRSKKSSYASEASKFAAEQTRKKRKAEKRDNVVQSLSGDDIRKQGLIDVQLAGLAELRKNSSLKET